MSDEEEPAPYAPVSENEDDDAGSYVEQASMTQKRRKTSVTKCEDEYVGEALSAKANTGKFLGLRAEKPVKPNSAKTSKQWEGFNSQARWDGRRFRHAKGSRQVLECSV
jgi:hypothetical protein